MANTAKAFAVPEDAVTSINPDIRNPRKTIIGICTSENKVVAAITVTDQSPRSPYYKVNIDGMLREITDPLRKGFPGIPGLTEVDDEFQLRYSTDKSS